MGLAILHCRAQYGTEAPAVTIETFLSGGLPVFTIVGMPETAVRESKDRVRSAIISSGYRFPQQRITISLGPAEMRKTDIDLRFEANPAAIEKRADGSLRVVRYHGAASGRPYASVFDIAGADVVLTTFAALGRDVHYAGATRGSTRRAKRFRARQTPLVRIQFWRIVLDEWQLASGASKAAAMAERVAAPHRWAVSGTPFRKGAASETIKAVKQRLAELEGSLPAAGGASSRAVAHCGPVHAEGYCWTMSLSENTTRPAPSSRLPALAEVLT